MFFNLYTEHTDVKMLVPEGVQDEIKLGPQAFGVFSDKQWIRTHIPPEQTHVCYSHCAIACGRGLWQREVLL